MLGVIRELIKWVLINAKCGAQIEIDHAREAVGLWECRFRIL